MFNAGGGESCRAVLTGFLELTVKMPPRITFIDIASGDFTVSVDMS